MKALVRDKAETGLRDVPAPVVEQPDDVIVDVAFAGICRTDVYAAQRKLPTREPIILGHELSGRVRAVGSAVRHVSRGDAVTVLPALPCGACGACTRGTVERCGASRMLGVDVDGGFAEQVRVPGRAVFAVPSGLDLRAAAYTEPVASALAVRHAGIPPGARIGVFGSNRIAALTLQILAGQDVTVEPILGVPTEGRYDVVVETLATEDNLSAAMWGLAPEGLLVLKSRPPAPVPIHLRLAVEKQLTLRAVRYGPFPDALALLASGRLDLASLLGEDHPLEAFASLLLPQALDENRKQFFAVAP